MEVGAVAARIFKSGNLLKGLVPYVTSLIETAHDAPFPEMRMEAFKRLSAIADDLEKPEYALPKILATGKVVSKRREENDDDGDGLSDHESDDDSVEYSVNGVVCYGNNRSMREHDEYLSWLGE